MGQKNNSTTQRKWKQLSEKERYKIEALSQRGLSPTEIEKELNRDRRTIEREIAQGLTVQQNSDLTERTVYLADAAQRKHDEKAANKGRGLKIGKDHKLAKHIEEKIGIEGWSPDAVIGEINEQGLHFETSICTKTVYRQLSLKSPQASSQKRLKPRILRLAFGCFKL